MHTLDIATDTASRNMPRSPADRRTIFIVLSMLAGLIVLSVLVGSTDFQAPPAESTPPPSHPAVIGPLEINIHGETFVATQGAELLGCHAGNLSRSTSAAAGYSLTCADGARTGVITVVVFESAQDQRAWRIEHATDGFRMLSGTGVVNESGSHLTGEIQFGDIAHDSPSTAPQLG